LPKPPPKFIRAQGQPFICFFESLVNRSDEVNVLDDGLVVGLLGEAFECLNRLFLECYGASLPYARVLRKLAPTAGVAVFKCACTG